MTQRQFSMDKHFTVVIGSLCVNGAEYRPAKKPDTSFTNWQRPKTEPTESELCDPCQVDTSMVQSQC